MYRPRRHTRYLKLLDAGFCSFESRALSKVSPRVPYLKALIRERTIEFEKAIRWAKRKGLSEVEFKKQWLTHIKRRYVMKGWKMRTDRWGVTAAFRMLKQSEKGYKLGTPDYESPWEKRQRRWRDFIKSAEKYPVGTAYKRR